MPESQIQSPELCCLCKNDLNHGDMVVLCGNLKFFHFACYKKKSFLYKLFIPVKTFIIWKEVFVGLEEMSGAVKKRIDSQKELKIEQIQATGDSIETEVHELDISVPVYLEQKNEENVTENENQPKTNDNNEGDSAQNTKTEDIEFGDFNEKNLLQIIDEVNEMKNQFKVFAAEKENDEDTIKQLKLMILKYKKEIKELRWLISLRDEELLSKHSNSRSS